MTSAPASTSTALIAAESSSSSAPGTSAKPGNAAIRLASTTTDPATQPAAHTPRLSAADQLLRERRGEARDDPRLAEPELQPLCLRLDRPNSIRAHVLEQPERDHPIFASRPTADHSAVPPDRRPGVPVPVEERRRVLCEIPRALLPAHDGWVE